MENRTKIFKLLENLVITKEPIEVVKETTVKSAKFRSDEIVLTAITEEEDSPKVKKSRSSPCPSPKLSSLPFNYTQTLESSSKALHSTASAKDIFYKTPSPIRHSSISASRYSLASDPPLSSKEELPLINQPISLPTPTTFHPLNLAKTPTKSLKSTQDKAALLRSFKINSHSQSCVLSKKQMDKKLEHLKLIKNEAHSEVQRLKAKYFASPVNATSQPALPTTIAPLHNSKPQDNKIVSFNQSELLACVSGLPAAQVLSLADLCKKTP